MYLQEQHEMSTGGVAPVVELLPSKKKALISSLSTAKKKKKERKKPTEWENVFPIMYLLRVLL
jgi:hypothetical protein